MSNPKTLGPDGTLRDTVVFSTTVATRFFEGTVPSDAVEVQVSINGSGFSSDDTLIQWGDGTWVVPNPEYDPDGLFQIEPKALIGITFDWILECHYEIIGATT